MMTSNKYMTLLFISLFFLQKYKKIEKPPYKAPYKIRKNMTKGRLGKFSIEVQKSEGVQA